MAKMKMMKIEPNIMGNSKILENRKESESFRIVANIFSLMKMLPNRRRPQYNGNSEYLFKYEMFIFSVHDLERKKEIFFNPT